MPHVTFLGYSDWIGLYRDHQELSAIRVLNFGVPTVMAYEVLHAEANGGEQNWKANTALLCLEYYRKDTATVQQRIRERMTRGRPEGWSEEEERELQARGFYPIDWEQKEN